MVDGNTGKSGNKIWVAILSFLTVAIVGLVVAIVVVNMRGGEETGVVAVDCGQEVLVADVVNCVEKNYTEEESYGIYNEIIENRTTSVGLKNIDEIIELYQEFIENIENDFLVAALLTERAGRIMSLDYEKLYGNKVIADVIEADNIVGDLNTAVNVANAANYYGDLIVVEEYSAILLERQVAAGVNINAEGEG